MVRGIINSSFAVYERGNSSIFGSICQFVMVGRKFEAARHQLIRESFRKAQALVIFDIFLRYPERKPFKLVQKPMRLFIVLPWHKGFIFHTIMVDRNK